MTDKEFLQKTIEVSKESIALGGYPVGSIVVLNNEIIGKAISNGKNIFDATAHAEIIAIREASQKLQKRDLKNAVVYSSLEPCLMCFSACFWASIKKVVYACSKEKAGIKHFEGHNDLQKINENNLKKIEIIYLSELENEAFDVISNWEKNLTR